MSQILITGASGMLGTDVQSALAGRDVTPLGRADLDVTDRDAVRKAVTGHSWIINCAAYTKVDDAESHELQAHQINAIGAENLAIAAHEHGATLIQLSTDYVFNGSAQSPYRESTEHDPISAYGRTKAQGEQLALAAHPTGTVVVRTAWLYGQHGPNFAATMLKLAQDRPTLTVVDDQQGQPTWTVDLAEQLRAIIDANVRSGIFHGTNSGATTWFGFAREIFRLAGLDPERIHPTDSTSFVRPAPRPAYSVLGHDAWATVGIAPMRPWNEALAAAFRAGIFTPAA